MKSKDHKVRPKLLMRTKKKKNRGSNLAGAGWRKLLLKRERSRLEGYNVGWRYGYRDGRWAAIKEGICKPKIAYVIPGCSISGGLAVILQHANRLKQRGYDVILISMNESTQVNWYPIQVPIVKKSEAPSDRDVVVATFWATLNTARKIEAKKRIYFIQSDESRFYSPTSLKSKLAYNTYKTKDFTFMTMAGWLKKWLLQRFKKHAVYIPNGLDSELMHETIPIEPKGDRIRVLLEGPIAVKYKGMSDAFAAVKELDCEVWCVSSAGRPDPSWRCDRFYEGVSYETMKHIYSSCHILLKMSRVESFLYPPLEMMACGGVSVVAEVTGTDEYLINNYNSLVIPNDVRAASDAVQRLIADQALRERLIAGGHETVMKWGWDRSIDMLEHALTGHL
ncbi:glycosyltransferase family 4 protein [Paenibacillus arenilitoris]|uniref:Glycosyltransferase family 4 protein n=1 Tax=Paenibacillus arenilitoris TaxID=2772299 RepID=A0A927CTZ0_9BACL|nr:glycosyltransferase family 4 protein [Paenibacillus arenilitoris]MBD2871525.1 glycosyltransferase family 4 protein [Paenibacillus arenilitoris]